MEKPLTAEALKENHPHGKRRVDKRVLWGSGILLLAIAIGGYSYWKTVSARVYIEKGEIAAPQINLSSQNGGILEKVWVKEGEAVGKNEPVAQVGDEIVRSRDAGLIVKITNEVGRRFNPGEAIVTMIKPEDLRIEGTLSEDEGLRDIRVGEKAIFTVDAFGSKEYEGFVDEVSPSAKDKGLAFSISDKRATNDFIIKVRYNIGAYSELKDGMSAKIWVYKQ